MARSYAFNASKRLTTVVLDILCQRFNERSQLTLRSDQRERARIQKQEHLSDKYLEISLITTTESFQVVSSRGI